MAELLVAYETPVSDASGSYRARAVGRQAEDGMWEGWLEFESVGSPRNKVIVTSIESRQPEKVHLVYWATGLQPIYLEGALARARNPTVVRVRVAEHAESDGPAPRLVKIPAEPPAPSAVLDPLEIGRKNLGILDQELRALDRPRLVNIIAAYQLNPAGEDLSWMSDAQLVRFIVVAVETQLTQRAR